MTKVNWQDHFKSAIQSAENLYSKDATNVSLLMFCLRAKLLPIADYLNWAKENFQIPVLSEKYFQAHTPQPELFKKWQQIHTWSNECLPIGEWDGVLLIACLEPPENYTPTDPTVFVLTSHEVLDQTWARFTKSEKATQAQPQPQAGADLADMTALAATVVAPPGANNFFSADGELILQDDTRAEISEELSSSEESEQPDGAELSAEDEATGMPEGLFGDSPAPKMEPLNGTGLTKTEPITLSPMNTEVTRELHVEAKVKAAKPTIAPPQAVPVKKGPRTSQPLMVALDEKTKIDGPPVMEENLEDVIKAPVASPGTSENSTAFFLERMRKQGPDQFDKEVISSFQHLKTFFKKSMLLAIGDQDRLVKPILWDGGFEMQKPATSEFNLTTPSIFRIVNGTQKPYHGYVVPNDLNESFFEAWNHGQIPDHITVVPLMEGDHVVGMIMGFGEKACYNKNVLQFTENVAKGLSTKILKAPATTAA